MRAWSWSYGFLGALVSSLALINLIARAFHVGLEPAMADILKNYRDFVHPFMSALLGWLHWILPHWTIPAWLKDAYTLSFVGGMGGARYMVAVETQRVNAPAHPGYLAMSVAAGLLTSLTFLGLALFVFVLLALLPMTVLDFFFPYLKDDNDGANTRKILRLLTTSVVGGILGVVVFFVVNWKL